MHGREVVSAMINVVKVVIAMNLGELAALISSQAQQMSRVHPQGVARLGMRACVILLKTYLVIENVLKVAFFFPLE